MSETRSLRELFEALLDVPTEARVERARALDLDSGAREQLIAMLEADQALQDSASPPVPPRRHPWPGQTVGGWRLVAPVGDGGMGSVWLAVSARAPEVTVAVKFPVAHSVDEQEAAQRLLQERRVLAALDHPNVVSIVDAGETTAGLPFVVLEFLGGRPCDRWLLEQQPTRDQLLTMLGELAAAVDHLATRGIVHRDIKPSNVLVSADGAPSLLDFGVARITETASLAASVFTQGQAPSTPGYASPEHERGEPVDASADVFGFGRLARTLLSRHDEAWASSSAVSRVLDRADHEDAAARPSSASEVVAQLQAQARPVLEKPSSVVARTALGLAGLALGAGLGAGLGQGNPASEAELLEALVISLEVTPALDLALPADQLAELAARWGDDVNLAIAAAVVRAEEGDREQALEEVFTLTGQSEEADPQRAFELAVLCSELGFPDGARGVLRDVNPELLAPLQALEAAVLLPLNEVRCGDPVDSEALRSGLEDLEDQFEDDLELLGDGLAFDTAERLEWLLLSLGDPDSLAIWLEDSERAAWGEPWEHGPGELSALLTLHRHLLGAGVCAPLDDDLLAELEAQGAEEDELDEHGELARSLAIVRELRVHGTLGHDPRRARHLAEAGVNQLELFEHCPLDVLARALGVQALALRAAGQPGDAAALFARAQQQAVRATGESSGLTALLRAWSAGTRDGPVPLPSLDPVLAERLAQDLDGESRRRGGRPWWAPGP